MKTMKIVLSSLLLMVALTINATELSDAKSQGLVGEQPDGYLGVIVSSSATETLVSAINAKRKSNYQSLATKNNLTLSQVEALAAKKAYSKTEAGHFIWVKGKWSKK